jgi:hypothetical protein
VLEGADEHRPDRPDRPEVAGAGESPDGDEEDRDRDERRDAWEVAAWSWLRRRQVGDEWGEVASGLRGEGVPEALLELVGVEPACGGVRAEGLRCVFAFRVRGSCLVRHGL